MTSKFEMTFTLNGCINITDVNIIVNDVTTNIAKEGYCNYLLPEGKRQTQFSVFVNQGDYVML